MDSSSGQLRLDAASKFDHELWDGKYYVTVAVTDSGVIAGRPTQPESAHLQLVVSALDVNEPPVMPDVTYNVKESCGRARCRGIGHVIGTLTAVDDDKGQQETLSFEITAGNEDGKFEVFTDTDGKQKLRLAGALDFEAKASYALVVAVTDSGVVQGSAGTPLTGQATVTVLVKDVNEPPLVDDVSVSIPELSAVGSDVGPPLQSRNPETAQNVLFSIREMSRCKAVEGGLPSCALISETDWPVQFAPLSSQLKVVDSSGLDYENGCAFALVFEFFCALASVLLLQNAQIFQNFLFFFLSLAR